jgi:hypothetical protein
MSCIKSHITVGQTMPLSVTVVGVWVWSTTSLLKLCRIYIFMWWAVMYCCCQGRVLKSELASGSDLPFVSYCHWYIGTIISDIVLEIGVMKVCMSAQTEGFGFFICPQWQANADVSRGRIILSWLFSAQRNRHHSLRSIRPLIWLILLCKLKLYVS